MMVWGKVSTSKRGPGYKALQFRTTACFNGFSLPKARGYQRVLLDFFSVSILLLYYWRYNVCTVGTMAPGQAVQRMYCKSNFG